MLSIPLSSAAPRNVNRYSQTCLMLSSIVAVLGLGCSILITSDDVILPLKTNAVLSTSGKCDIIVFSPSTSSPLANASR